MLDLIHSTTTRQIVTALDATGPDNALVSVQPSASQRTVELVIGGWWDKRCACIFTKSGLAELIYTLREVHFAMRDDG